MAPLALKLARGEAIGASVEDNYIPRGVRVNFFEKERGSKRAVDMLLKKLNDKPFETEYPMPSFDRVPPNPAVKDLSKATIALVTSGGIVPKGNPDHIESSNASHYGEYDITGVDVIYDRFRNRADVLHYELTAPADGDYLLWIEDLQLPDGGSVSSTFLSAIVKPDSAGYVYNYTHGRYRETAAPDRLEEGLTEYLQEGSAIPIQDAQAGARYHIWLFGIQGNRTAPSFRLTVTLQP